jgi:hypothetical protein
MSAVFSRIVGRSLRGLRRTSRTSKVGLMNNDVFPDSKLLRGSFLDGISEVFE